MRLLDQVRENVGIAFDALRTSKLRSALTILGVVIGVSTVMSMAAIVRGIQRQIVRTIEIAGPTTFLRPEGVLANALSTPTLSQMGAPSRRPHEARSGAHCD
jgi:hypothetical protein